MSSRSMPGLLAGVLLLAAGVVVGASSLADAPAALETVGLALAGAAVVAVTDVQIRAPRLRTALVVLALLVVGDRLTEHGVATGRPWAATAGLAAYVLWVGVARTPRAVIWSLSPALVALAAPLTVRAGGTHTPAQSLLLVAAGLVAGLVAVPRARAAARRATIAQQQDDLDAVVLANVELRHVSEARDAAHRIARIATDLLAAEGAVVWLQGPGRLLCAGGHGVTPPPDREIARGSNVDRVLQSGGIATDADETVLPLTGSGGVFGAVTVSRPTRPAESFVSSVLQVFGAQAGYALERLRAVDSLIDERFVDPVTGVGNRLAATSSLATLHPGDAVLLLSVDELLTIRAIEGDARADLTLGQLGLHLRAATRAGDLVARFGDDVFFVLLRDLSASTEAVVSRILDSWQATGTAGHLRAGAALHFGDTSPLDTLDRASDALDATRADRDVTIDLAAERAAWGRA